MIHAYRVPTKRELRIGLFMPEPLCGDKTASAIGPNFDCPRCGEEYLRLKWWFDKNFQYINQKPS